MGFRLEASESVVDGLKRLVREQVDKVLAEIDDKELPRQAAVHQVRKRCKKIRAALRLVRPVFSRYRPENAHFRNAARQLAELRDAEVMVATFNALISAFHHQVDARHFASLRRQLLRHRREIEQDQEAQASGLAKVRAQMCEARERIAAWTLDADGFEAIQGGFLKTYARGRKALRLAYEKPSAAAFHEWRKRVKYHRYHIRLLRNVWQPVMRPLRRELAALSELLGDDHDLAVFQDALLNEPEAFGKGHDLEALLELIDRRSADLRARARPLGSRIYAEKPKQAGRRFGQYWEVWKAQCFASGSTTV